MADDYEARMTRIARATLYANDHDAVVFDETFLKLIPDWANARKLLDEEQRRREEEDVNDVRRVLMRHRKIQEWWEDDCG